jgi:hypothetical protein
MQNQLGTLWVFSSVAGLDAALLPEVLEIKIIRGEDFRGGFLAKDG